MPAFPVTALLDSFKRSAEEPLSGAWSLLAPPSTDTGRVFSSTFGWVATTAANGSGAYWNAKQVKSPGAVRARLNAEQLPESEWWALWLCYNSASKNGYRIRFQGHSLATKWTVWIEKCAAGAFTTLAKIENVTIPTNPIGLGATISEGKIKAWIERAEWEVVLEAEDASYTEGYVGLQQIGNAAFGTTNFEATSHEHTLTVAQPQAATKQRGLARTFTISQPQVRKLLGPHSHSLHITQVVVATEAEVLTRLKNPSILLL